MKVEDKPGEIDLTVTLMHTKGRIQDPSKEEPNFLLRRTTGRPEDKLRV